MLMQLKDYVTLMNGACGFICVVLVMRGELVIGSLFVYFGWAFDALDGPVARLTGRQNKFGGELDNMCDMITWAMAPSFVVYAYYERFFSTLPALQDPSWLAWILAAALSSLPILCGAIRFARFTATELRAHGYWIGLPRPVSAFVMVAFLNSHLFEHPIGPWVGILVCTVLPLLNLSLLPFISHHAGWWSGFLSGLLTTVALTSLAALVVGIVAGDYGYFFDMFFFWMVGYIGLAWTYIPRPDLEKIRTDIAEWRKREMAG